jgi:hypothetical protein
LTHVKCSAWRIREGRVAVATQRPYVAGVHGSSDRRDRAEDQDPPRAEGQSAPDRRRRKIGVGERTYQTWENAEAKPAYRNLERLAEFYGVSEDFILSGESTRPEDPVVVSQTVTGGFEEFRAYVARS